jgi:hypothetical protein
MGEGISRQMVVAIAAAVCRVVQLGAVCWC